MNKTMRKDDFDDDSRFDRFIVVGLQRHPEDVDRAEVMSAGATSGTEWEEFEVDGRSGWRSGWRCGCLG